MNEEEEELIATGSYSSFFWENNIVEPWMMIFNSDNSVGDEGGGSDEKINGKKPLIDLSSYSPTPNQTPMMTPPLAGSSYSPTLAGSSYSPTPNQTPTMTPPLAGSSYSPTLAGSSYSPTPNPTPTMTPPLTGSSYSPTLADSSYSPTPNPTPTMTRLLAGNSNSPAPNPTPTVTPPLPAGRKRSRHGGLPRGGGKKTAGGCAAITTADGFGVGESDHEIHIWTERERRTKMRNMFSGLHALLPQLPPKADKTTIVDEAINYIQDLQQSVKKLQKQKLEMLVGGGTTAAPVYYDQQQPLAILASSTISGFKSREAFFADQAATGSDAPPPTSTINNALMITTNMNNASSSSSASPQCSFSIPVAPCNINPLTTASLQTWCSPNVVLSVNGKDAQISVSAPKKIGLFSTVCNVLEKHKLEVISAHISSDLFRSMFMIHAHATGAACEQFPEPLSVEELYKLAVGEIIFWLSI